MAQVLKDEIKERIFEAALDEFYQKDYKSATMRDIAGKAGISTGLVYSYYKNKQALFEEIVQPVLVNLPETLKRAEKASGHPFEKFINIEKQFFLDLLDRRREFIILIDKSAGTSYHDAKEKMICIVEEHIKKGFKKMHRQEYEDLFTHILASNFVESLLEIIRHYKSKQWAVKMLDLVTKCYFYGIDSL